MTNLSDMKTEVREITGYTNTTVLSTDGLDAAVSTAKRHIRVKKSLPADVEWFDSEKVQREEALFWFTCLFTKVQTGELDSQDLQIGAIDQKTLLAKSNDNVTVWYRNASDALQAMKASNSFRSASPQRDDRSYEKQTFSRESSSGSGTDSTDL